MAYLIKQPNYFWADGIEGTLVNNQYNVIRAAYRKFAQRHRLLIRLRGWEEKLTCPYCRSENPIRAVLFSKGSHLPLRWRCGSCHKFFTILTNTRIYQSHLRTNQLISLCFLVAAHPNPSRSRVKRMTGMKSNKTVDAWLKKLKHGLAHATKSSDAIKRMESLLAWILMSNQTT